MPFTTAVINGAVDSVTAQCAYVSAHSADPGGTGASELAGGVYARQAVTWGAAASKVATMSGGTRSIPIPGGSTTAYLGLWSAVSGGTFKGSVATTSTETYSGDGILDVTALTVTGA